MARLHYLTNASLDGYVEDDQGRFDWSVPDAELHAFIGDLIRPFGTYLYGRRMYDTMAVWETDPSLAGQSALLADFAATWQAADKVVYSTTLTAAATARTRIERSFDPAVVRALKDAATADLAIGGATMASAALQADLVDEYHLFVHPIVLGSGKPALASDTLVALDLLEERRVGRQAVYLRYRVVS